MNLDEARRLARSLMDQHGLQHWRFAFDRAAARFGSCAVSKLTITLSWKLTMLNDVEQVRDTLLHEIAHALAPGDGHGGKWKTACRKIGAKPFRCFTSEEVVIPARRLPRFEQGCTRCDWWVARAQLRVVRGICKHCKGEVLYREKLTGRYIRVSQVGPTVLREILVKEK